ncbi:MAG: VWA domain-containing protein [Deltaproteobacteria bacterium]|nr:VWA domain-containing protein [Deltaproteobacteria bacterium]
MNPEGNIQGPSVDEWQITSVGGLDLSALIIISIGVVGAVIWTWRSLDPIHPLRLRAVITIARALALLTALGLLLQPAVHFRSIQDAPGRLAILVDASGSMARRGDRGRLMRARELAEQAGKSLELLSPKHRLSWYRFAEDLVPAVGPEDAFSTLEQGGKTDIRSAIIKLAEGSSLDTAPLDGVVVISDGADTEIMDPGDGSLDAAWARQLGVPVNTVFIGETGEHKDLAIERAEVDPFAFSRSETPIAVTLRSVGFEDREVEVFLWQDGSVLQRRTVQLVGGEGRFTFTIFPSALGQHVLTITLPTPAEDEVPENNRAHVAFEVIRDKFRILHLVGRPSWDQRFLRETFKSWPRVDLVSFYVLRTAFQSSTYGSSGMALIPFPTEDIFEGHLNEFDLVVFHSFEPASVGVDRYLDRIAEFVKQGGALVLIGGNVGLGGGIVPSKAFKEILPVELLGPSTQESRRYDATPYRPGLTDVGAVHPLMQIAQEPEKNLEIWRSLASLDGIGRVAALAEGAFRLAEHPFLRADDGPAPFISVKEAGRGRTLAIASDSLWRWRFTGPMGGGPADAYAAFWRRAVSWLTRDPELNRLRVKVNPSPVLTGELTHFDIQLLDEAYRPMSGAAISCKVSRIRKDGSETSEEFEALLDDQGRYLRQWQAHDEGPHRLTVSSAGGLNSTKRFLVDSRKTELSHLEPRKSLLEAIARDTGGHFETDTLSPASWAMGNGAERRVLSHTEVALWDQPIAVLLLIVFLAAEWFLRHRLGLQ